MGRETLAGLTANAVGRLEAEAAYGIPAFGGRATGTPYLGVGQTKVSRLVRVGYRLALANPDGLELDHRGYPAREHCGRRGSGARGRAAPDAAVNLHMESDHGDLHPFRATVRTR